MPYDHHCLADILSQRWRLLFRPIIAEPDKVSILVKAMCVLHNFLSASEDTSCCPPGLPDSVSANVDLSERFQRILPVSPLEGLTTTSRSINIATVQVRERSREYFAGNGSVDWQMRVINRQ